jgi:hypothetical protein
MLHKQEICDSDTLTVNSGRLNFAARRCCGPWRTAAAAQVIIHFQGVNMRKAVLAVATALSFAGGLAGADPVHDWHDLDKIHNHVQEAIHEMEHARAANHCDMAGHGAKAEELLRQAERELHAAVEAARAAH